MSPIELSRGICRTELIEKIERDEVRPSMELLEKFADRLGLSRVRELFPWGNEPNQRELPFV